MTSSRAASSPTVAAGSPFPRRLASASRSTAIASPSITSGSCGSGRTRMIRIRCVRGGRRSSRISRGPIPRTIGCRRFRVELSGIGNRRPTVDGGNREPDRRGLRAMTRLQSFALACALAASAPLEARAEDGYELWLRYRRVADAARLAEYRAAVGGLSMPAETPTLRVARDELTSAPRGLTGLAARVLPHARRGGTLIVGTPASSPAIASLASRELAAALRSAGPEGYVIRAVAFDGRPAIVIAANRDIGVLYGAFHFIRLMQMHRPLAGLDVVSAP